MHLHEFLGQVQHRAHLSSIDDALRATRCTLETLAERLEGGEPEKLAAQLPRELQAFLENHTKAERFDSSEFFHRVSQREGTALPIAVHHARAVFDVLQDATSAGVIEHVKSQLPHDFHRLFAGSEGRMPHA